MSDEIDNQQGEQPQVDVPIAQPEPKIPDQPEEDKDNPLFANESDVTGRSPATSPNVEMTKDWSGPLKNPERVDMYLSFMNGDIGDFNDLSENHPNIDISKGAKGSAYVNVLNESRYTLTRDRFGKKAIDRNDSLWRQSVASDDGAELAAGRPRFSAGSGDALLTGERAIMKAQAVTGLGAVVQIPLWHTGIWISIKTPSGAELLELQRRLSNEKISLGRMTNGLIFSNTSVYTNSYLINFALSHIYDASVKDFSPQSLKAIIKITDIPTIIWGLASSIYPHGYPYARACMNYEKGCQHIVKEKLSLPKLMWTDNRSLTAWQRKLMSRRNSKFSDEELARYQDEHPKIGPRTFSVNESLSFTLNVPTIEQYENSGFEWVDNIVKMMEDSFGVSLRGDERSTYIEHQGRMTSLRQYGHWVQKVMIDNEETGDDRETIEGMMEVFSSSREVRETLFEEIADYIDNSTVSLIAIPKYNCPNCGGDQSPEDNKHPYLIPIDPSRIFFTLLDQHIFKALTNSLI